jgi:glycine cleavage system H protein
MIKYSEDHEWVQLEGDVVTVGITDFAQNELGDIVFVELPELGTTVSAGGDMATVESFKAASSVYAPLSGEVVEINDTLEADPAQVNTDPMGDGWFVKIKIEDPAALDKLLDEDAYIKLTQ